MIATVALALLNHKCYSLSHRNGAGLDHLPRAEKEKAMSHMTNPAQTYTLESGATYTVLEISPDKTRCRCQLTGTNEAVWVDCIDGQPVETPRFSSVEALSTEALERIVDQYDRETRLAEHGRVRYTVRPETYTAAKAELKRRHTLPSGFFDPKSMTLETLECAITAAQNDLGDGALPDCFRQEAGQWLEIAAPVLAERHAASAA
jgi:hypothetical protein